MNDSDRPYSGQAGARYEETGEPLIQVAVLDDGGFQQGEHMMLTETQIDELVDQLPEGWTTEEVG
jgi:hypothetical protein